VRRLLPALAPLPAAACGGADATPLSSPSAPVSPGPRPVTVTFEGGPPLAVEVARTPPERARGLMYRTSVPDGTGMIFLFPQRVNVGFWMKNTLVPLSIAYVDGDRVVSTAEMVPCRADPCRSYEPAREYTAAVEAPAGFFPSHRVGPGTRMTVSGALPPAS
jgi:uncharacterized membrane protein (UPF0127 family)